MDKRGLVKIGLSLMIVYLTARILFISFLDKEEVKFYLPRVNSEVKLAGEEVGELNQIELTKVIINLADELEEPPRKAYKFNGKIISGKEGKKIDITATLNKTLQVSKGKKIKPVYKKIVPLVTKEKLLKEKYFEFKLEEEVQGKIIGHYTTFLKNNKPNRRKNIELALDKLNNYRLSSQEEFSFNQLIGKPKAGEGYKPAPVIINDKLVPRVGGGICQVSSTLYNAVNQAELEILEHHYHSKPVNYVPSGKDATVYPGEKDFKFLNNKEGEIIILTDLIDRYAAVYLIITASD